MVLSIVDVDTEDVMVSIVASSNSKYTKLTTGSCPTRMIIYYFLLILVNK
jgi:hypothetical protein